MTNKTVRMPDQGLHVFDVKKDFFNDTYAMVSGRINGRHNKRCRIEITVEFAG
jgi:hypothetical protein